MKKKKINIIFTFIAIYSLFLGSIYVEATSLITKTTFNKMNESLTAFYNNFDENDKYLSNGPFTCSGDRIKCTGSSNIGTLSKKEYEIIGSNSYLSATNSNNKFWTNNTNGSNAYVVNINSIEEKPQTDSYGIRGAVYVKSETTFSGTGTRIDPYVLNYKEQVKQDINLVAFYIDEDGDGSFEDEPNNGLVDKIDQETAYSLVSSVCTDSTGQEFTDMITYNDINKSITINPVQYQLSCSIRLMKQKGPIAIETGDGFSFAIDFNHHLWAWGTNLRGRLGDGTITDSYTPKLIADDKTWESISALFGSALAIDTEGNLWAWGDNSKGKLGDGTTTDSYTPKLVAGDKTWKSISAGMWHSLGIDIQGNLYAWGVGAQGRLGDGTSTDSYTPKLVAGNKTWKSISAGQGHSLGIDIQGNLYAWGWNGYGQLGDGTTIDRDTPKLIESSKTWKFISAGIATSIAIDTENNLYYWGDYNSVPTLIEQKKWRMASSKAGHTLAVDEYGNLYSWGNNGVGQLGNGTKVSTTELNPYNLTAPGYFGN